MKKFLIISLSFLCAIVLSILPLPQWAEWLRPAWVVLVLIYWVMVFPFQFSLSMAFILGLISDILNGTLLGEHALALTLVAYLSLRLYRKLRLYPLWQQALAVFMLTFFYQFVIFLIQGVSGHIIREWEFWLTAATSMLLWPCVYLLLHSCQQRFKV